MYGDCAAAHWPVAGVATHCTVAPVCTPRCICYQCGSIPLRLRLLPSNRCTARYSTSGTLTRCATAAQFKPAVRRRYSAAKIRMLSLDLATGSYALDYSLVTWPQLNILAFNAADIGLDGIAVGRLKTADGHHLVRYDDQAVEFLAKIKKSDAGAKMT